MEQQNQEGDKKKTLKINEYLTEEKLKKKLKKIKQFEKIEIFVEFCEKNFTQYFQIIKDFLNDRKDFHSLEIYLYQIFNLVIDDSLYLFKDIPQITNLSLYFECMTHLSKTQKQNLSTCLLSFQNLECLQLSFEFSKVFFDDNQLCLFEFYKKSLNLRSLDISVSSLKNQSYYLNLLLDGIRYLKELKSFSFQIVYGKQQASYVLNILEEELNQNPNLTKLSIDLGYKIFTSHSCFQQIQRILKNQNKLLNLDLSINFYYQCQLKNQQSQLSITDICHKFLPNLKKLSLKLYHVSIPFGIFILKALSKISQIDQIILDFKIKRSNDFFSYYQEEIKVYEDFGEQICKFVNIESLTFNFFYSVNIKFYELINFISKFNSLKRLKQLKIDISSMKDFSNTSMLNVESFFEVMKQLSVIDIKIRFGCSYFANNYYINLLTQSISNSENLEELHLDINDYSNASFKPQELQFQEFRQNKQNLKQLQINFGNFLLIEESQVLSLFSSLKLNKDLESLLLNFYCKTCLSKQALVELSDNLIDLKKLDKLAFEIQNNSGSFDDLGFQKLIDTFKNLNCLTDFSIKIDKDQFSKNTIKNLLGIFENQKNLNYLTIKIEGSNFLNDEEEEDFGSSFKFPKNLEKMGISLDINEVKWKSFENMFQRISELKKISLLILKFESLLIQKQEVILFKQYLGKLKLVQDIQLRGYSFSLLHLVLLFQEIQSLSYIQFENQYIDQMYCTAQAKRKFIMDKHNKINEETNSQQLLSKSEDHPQKLSLKIQTKYFLTNYDVQNSYDQNLIPFIFESLKFVTHLEFEICKNNQLGENNSQLIFKSLSYLHFLKNLNIEVKQDNQIGDESILLLGQSLPQIQGLEVLNLVFYEKGNNLEWQNLNLFFGFLVKLKQLSSLSIKFVFEINFDITQKESFSYEICRYVAKLHNLKDLSIKLKNLTIQSDFLNEFNNLCQNLSKSLRNLTLQFDQLQDQNFKQMSRSLLMLQNLQKISISQTNTLIKKMKRVAQINHTYEYDYYNYD
ncbi:hypothetical protein ABPG74_009841 [Tetrahymena malaccensis]